MATFFAIVLVIMVVSLIVGWIVSIPLRWVHKRQRKAGLRTRAQIDLADAVEDAIRRSRDENK